MKYRFSLFASTFVFLVVFLAHLVPQSASAQQYDEKYLKPSSFRPDNRTNLNHYRLYDGDVIMMTVEEDQGIAEDQIEFVLKTDPNVTWWKSIMAQDGITKSGGSWGEWSTVNSISTQDDDHGPKSMRINLAEINQVHFQLVFAKAKVLGVHTEMYFFVKTTQTFAGLKGKRVTFTWQKD